MLQKSISFYEIKSSDYLKLIIATTREPSTRARATIAIAARASYF